MEPEPMPSFPEQALSEHGSFVRRLARKLLVDAHLADDVAQEAWSRYFAAPPASANPRGWFARTLRNLATNSLRARARRAEHEQRGARAESLRSGADEAEQAELLRTLVEAVLALEPAQRDTLLALYFRGVDAKTLARESGVPEPTVRDRQRRALATLRQRLDGKFGDKRAWGAGLARLAGPPESAPMPLGLGALAAAAGFVALGSLGVVAWASAVAEGEPSAPAVSSSEILTVSENSAPEAAEPALGATSREAPTLSETPPPSVRSDGQEDHAVESIPQVVLRGRFVTSAGHPLAGVPYSLGVGGAAVGTERQIDPPFPEGIDGVGGTSGADGRFEVSMPPVRSHCVTLDAKLAGYSRVAWDVDGKPAGEYDLGDVTLYRGATLIGRIVDAKSQPMTGLAWHVSATVAGDLLANEAYRTFIQAKSARETAEFRLEGLLPGLTRLNVRSATSDQVPFEIDVAEGDSITRNFVYSGADPRRRLLVDPSIRHDLSVSIDPERLHLIAPNGRRLTGSGNLSGLWDFLFDDLEPGVYALEVDDPRFDFVRMEGLPTGSVAQPKLEGNSAFTVTVMDVGGQQVEAESVEVELRNVNFHPRGFRVHAGKGLLPGGLVRGCVAGDYVLRARHQGALGQIKVEDLLPGETRQVTVQLVPGTRIAGRVVDESGEPHVGLEVLAVRPAQENDGEGSEVLRALVDSSARERYRKEVASARTDGDGAFDLKLEESGTIFLRAVNAIATSPLGQALELRPGESCSDLVLTLPRPATVSGVVHGPASAKLAGMRVLLAPLEDQRLMLNKHLDLELGSDGRFLFGNLRAQRYGLCLSPPSSRSVRSTGSVIHHGGTGWCSSAEGGFWNGIQLADITVLSGADLELDLNVAGESWPGQLELEVRVNGQLASNWGLSLREDHADSYCDLDSGTNEAGICILALFAGRYLVTIEDPLTGWTHALPDPIVVQASQVTRQILEVERP